MKSKELIIENNRTYFNQITILITLVLSMILSCSKREPLIEPKEEILVKIGNKSISVDEFMRRAEYTVRPPYCRNNGNLDKKIIINSLIAEKLMSLEAGDTNKFITNEKIQTYLRGRKEQVMRQLLYEKEAREKVVLDTTRLIKMLNFAGRKYKIAFFNMPDSNLTYQLYKKMKSHNKTFESVYFEATGLDTLPQKEVEWSGHEHDLILDSLFSKPLIKNQIVGPIKIDKNQYMMIKVNGWIDRPAITRSLTQERWRNITDEYTQREAVKLYDNYIRKVMKGKQIDFVPEPFYKIADLLGPVYIKTNAQKEEMMQNAYWDQNEDVEKFKDLQTKIEVLYQEPLFKVDNKIWTVKDFVDELTAHPLVFRKKTMKNSEFGQELQFAIMDMIRDKFLAQEAYQRGYDKVNVVQRNVNMWQDNLNYQYYKSQYLHSVKPDSVTEMEYIPLIENFLNPRVDSLQKKYADIIEVDVEAFNNIKLTRIDMSVTQQNVPFVKPVPSFPLVTTDNRLDYGKKMEKTK